MEEGSREKIFSPPVKLKARVWEHFGFHKNEKKELDMTHAVCKHCGQKVKYSGNTTNLHLHMTRHHVGISETPVNATATGTQASLTAGLQAKFPTTSPKAKKITDALVSYICKDLRPYSSVENEGFRALIAECEPRYTIPTRRFITETAVPRLYDEVKRHVIDSISEASRVAITCDGWTSRATQSYVTLTCHFISENWEMLSYVLQTRVLFGSHSGHNVGELLLEVFEEWGLTAKEPVLVTDNASNMVIAAEHAKLLHVRCFAHTLNLAAQRALKTTAVGRLLGKIRHIVTFFRKSALASQVLQEKQKLLNLPKHKLMNDVPTRWNSAFDMVERFLEQQPAICATLLSAEVCKNAKELWTMSDTDLTNAEDVAKTLRPLKVATLVMSEEKTPTVSIIAPLQAQLCQGSAEQPDDSGIVKEVKRALAQDLGKRYSNKSFLQMASALDPRFKALPFLTEGGRDDIFAAVGREAAELSEVLLFFLHNNNNNNDNKNNYKIK